MKNKFLPILLAINLLFSNVIFGQAPNLGTAANFALLTSAGAFSNTGNTTVVGDIGTDAGAFTGFPPGTVTGQIHVTDATSAQAATDVCSAYSQLDGVTCGTTISTTLGNGQSLNAGVYCTGAASTLNGNLILDGQGDPNALFIIKINGSFSTSTFASVNLLNSASINNVYWQVNGEFILGDSSIFRGTVITSAGAITLLEGSTLQGRGLACGGAISLHNNSVTNSLGVLAVTLVNFSALKQGSSALLKWSTASEQNSKNFIIERGSNAQTTNWKTIGTLPGAGNSTSMKQYSLADNTVSKGANYYRLRSTHTDGTYSLSKVEVVSFDEASAQQIKIFSNPMKNSITVSGAMQGSSIMLSDITGKTLRIQSANGYGTDEITTNNLSSGIYVVKVASADGTVTTKKINK